MFSLPQFSSSMAACGITSTIAVDQNINPIVSTNIATPFYNAATGNWEAIPIDISVEQDYTFYFYSSAHFSAPATAGRTLFSEQMTLVVGCTDSIIITDNASFITSIDLLVADSLTNVYTFYEPFIDQQTSYDDRSRYCQFTSHQVVNVQVTFGEADPAGIDFSTVCSPTLADPSCSSLDILSTTTEYDMTFNIHSFVEGRTLPHESPLVTVTVRCGPDSTDIIPFEYLEDEQTSVFVRNDNDFWNYHNITDLAFECTYVACCKSFTFTIVEDIDTEIPHAALTQIDYHDSMTLVGSTFTNEITQMWIPTAVVQNFTYWIKVEEM